MMVSLISLKLSFMQTQVLYQHFKKHPKISTDTRNITPDSLFFALKGINFNGNRFADEALKAGAAYAIIDEEIFKKDDRYILVNDVLTALQDLAKYHRSQLSIPVIAITGTNGKTTTKELLSAVLKQKFNTYATKGNLNNHIGVPLSLLEIEEQTEIAIIEMGANHPKEIAFLCEIAQPTHGLITNVGKAHLEGFGGFEGVKKSKAELYEFLAQHKGVLFLQGDNPDLLEMIDQKSFKEVKTYGFFEESDVYGRVLEQDPFLVVKWTENNINHKVKTQIAGSYNLENILAAISIGSYFSVSPDAINKGLENYSPHNNRSQLLKTEQNTVICDYYNANASSMVAAIENFNSLRNYPKKVIILGDMFELGDETYREHKNIVTKAMFATSETCLFIGKAFYEHRKDIEGVHFFETTQQAIEFLKEKPFQDSLILLKASRGMAFENILKNL
jgi:UDP-N-acetylmuramoyl-tripeptide--D-alanyl-D-alanine ligase